LTKTHHPPTKPHTTGHRRYEAAAIGMLERTDAPILLPHAAALLAAVQAGSLAFVTAFLQHGLGDKLTAAQMLPVLLLRPLFLRSCFFALLCQRR
jgi:hypothetical protein